MNQRSAKPVQLSPSTLHINIQWTGSKIDRLTVIKADAIGQIKLGKIKLHDQVSLVLRNNTIPCRIIKIIILSAEKNFDGVDEAMQGDEVFLTLAVPLRYNNKFKESNQIINKE